MSDKKQIYFNEFNICMNKAVYLPLVSGILKANAISDPIINDNYQFAPFIFSRKKLSDILNEYDNPSIAAFSVSMWNHNLNMRVAKEVKNKYPNCLIVMGGPNVPFKTKDFFIDNPFIDVTVRGEGEKIFNQILIRALESKNFKDIPSISYRDPLTKECIINGGEPPMVKDLDEYPCPYASGMFDSLLNLDYDFQAIIETNRGCPFLCSFCFWGQGTMKMGKKFRHFGTERIKRIADWIGKNKIKYVFCADSNFGTFKKDMEIATYFANTKQHYQYPEKFRVCYGKNAEGNVFECGKILHDADMEKGITLSRQSNDEQVLINIQRSNIKLSVYNNLTHKYDNAGIPVYTEFILGLPGETYESFMFGLNEILECAVKTQIFVYFCQVLNNTELAQPEYIKRFEIKTVRIPLAEIHCSIHSSEDIIEYEDVVISTSTMSTDNWKKATVLSVTLQLFHSLKIGFYLMLYLKDRYNIKYMDFLDYLASRKTNIGTEVINKIFDQLYNNIDKVLEGNTFCTTLPDALPIYWTQEEAAYLIISDNIDLFYKELHTILIEYLQHKNINYNIDELNEVLIYQNMIIPSHTRQGAKQHTFSKNIPEYFDKFIVNKVELKEVKQTMTVIYKQYLDKTEFSKEVVLYGRKSNKMMSNTMYTNFIGE